MKSEHAHARHTSHTHEPRARRYALPGHVVDAVKPSPAREEAHDPESWFPLVAISPRQRHADHTHGTVRPPAAHPTVFVRPSPAREEAHDPASWFPIEELEALLAPEALVEEASRRPVATAIDLTPVVPDPTPAPATVVVPAPTRAEIQHQLRTRRVRRRVRLLTAGVGLAVSLLLARNVVGDDGGSDVAAVIGEGADGASGAGEPPAPVATPAVVAEPAMAVATTAPPPPEPAPLPNEDIWDRMAQCETGGNWQHYGPTWSGGLGIYSGTWREAGGAEFASLPRDATREQQIIVAERIKDRHGWTAWGCARTIGMG